MDILFKVVVILCAVAIWLAVIFLSSRPKPKRDRGAGETSDRAETSRIDRDSVEHS